MKTSSLGANDVIYYRSSKYLIIEYTIGLTSFFIQTPGRVRSRFCFMFVLQFFNIL